MNSRSLLRLSLALFFVSPLFLLLLSGLWPQWPALADWLPTLVRSTVQALLSTGLAWLLGALGTLGLLSVQGLRARLWLEGLVLVPAFLPVLFVVLSLISVLSELWVFPFGLAGVVLAHGVINSGMVAVALSRAIRDRLGGQIELAWVEGASRWLFWRYGIWPQLRGDMGLISLVVFSMSFTSFAAALVLGGVRATTMEVLIYQKLLQAGELGEGVALAILQMAILAGWSLLLSRHRPLPPHQNFQSGFLAMPSLLVVPLALSALVLMGHWPLMGEGFRQWQEWAELQEILQAGLLGSAVVTLGVGVLAWLLLLAVAGVLPHAAFRRFLLGYSAPSPALIGLALLWLGPVLGAWVWVKLVLGLTLLFLPPLYRWLGDGVLVSLESQVAVARSLGASWPLVWWRIVVPQVAPAFGQIAGLASLWASADFALTGIIAHRDLTLAQIIEGLLSSYRLELAAFLTLPLLLLGLMGFALMNGVGHVLGRKSHA